MFRFSAIAASISGLFLRSSWTADAVAHICFISFFLISPREVVPNTCLTCWEVFWERRGTILEEKPWKNEARGVRWTRGCWDRKKLSGRWWKVAICCALTAAHLCRPHLLSSAADFLSLASLWYSVRDFCLVFCWPASTAGRPRSGDGQPKKKLHLVWELFSPSTLVTWHNCEHWHPHDADDLFWRMRHKRQPGARGARGVARGARRSAVYQSSYEAHSDRRCKHIEV